MPTTSPAGPADKPANHRPLVAYCLERPTLLFSVKMALIVGSLQTIINHAQALLSARITPDLFLPICLTYLVPFMVALLSQAFGKRYRDRTTALRNAS